MKKRGWHMLRASRVLGYNDGRKVRVGVKMHATKSGEKKPFGVPRKREKLAADEPQTCRPGMHAAVKISKVMWSNHDGYTNGGWLCWVEVDGIPSGGCSKRYKFVGLTRTVLWMGKLPPEMHGKRADVLQRWAIANGCPRRAFK